jgi:hypothetical protein
MEPDIWPLDPIATAALVVRAIDDIDERTEEEDEDLLADLLAAAWGSGWAQSQ